MAAKETSSATNTARTIGAAGQYILPLLPLGMLSTMIHCMAGRFETEPGEPGQRTHQDDGPHGLDDSHGALCAHGAHPADRPHRVDAADHEHQQDRRNAGHDAACCGKCLVSSHCWEPRLTRMTQLKESDNFQPLGRQMGWLHG